MVHSEPGKGACFSIFLPAAKDESPAPVKNITAETPDGPENQRGSG
jgi:hypothetical protein